MTGEPTTLTLPRVCDPDEATLTVGDPVPSRTPTFTGPTIVRDADTGEMIAASLPFVGTARLRKLLSGMEYTGVQRAKNYRSKSQTFGFAPRRPMIRRESCALSAVASNRPDVQSALTELSDQCATTLASIAPEMVEADRETMESVLPEWRMGEQKLWTSGVVNKTAQLPYHRDGFNFPTWSAMPVIRRGVRGGHLHLPEYDLVMPCQDGYAVYFAGHQLVHGVTPIELKQKDGYRYSVVFYALRGMKDCYTYAVETAEGQRRRSERERRMAERLARGERGIPGRERRSKQ